MSAPKAQTQRHVQLIARAKAGERGAFDELFSEVEASVRAFVQSRIHAGAKRALDVDDIVQDTFVRGREAISGLRGQDLESLRRWLMGVARIALIRAADASRKCPPLEVSVDPPAKAVSPSKAVRRDERFDRLRDAIDALRGDQREVVRLVRIEGLSVKDAAARLGRSPDAAKKLLGRALKALRTRFGETESLHLPEKTLLAEEDPNGA
jgi:RNA polymerase sigma-70 factor (ECF subfamily)